MLAIVALAACSGASVNPSGPPTVAPTVAPMATPAPPTPTPVPITADQAMDAVREGAPWFDAVGRKDPSLIGQAAWWEAEPAVDGGWTIAVTVGWGDCPSGCINRHTWHWAVDAAGGVAFVAQDGPALPTEELTTLAATATSSGVGGEVTAGPTCPVERPGDSACAPRIVAGAVLTVADASGKEVARFTTDASGLYRIALSAGSYTLAAEPVDGLMGSPSPQPFTVKAGALTLLGVAYDTGIR